MSETVKIESLYGDRKVTLELNSGAPLLRIQNTYVTEGGEQIAFLSKAGARQLRDELDKYLGKVPTVTEPESQPDPDLLASVAKLIQARAAAYQAVTNRATASFVADADADFAELVEG